MQFPSTLAFITLLVSLPLTMHAQNTPNDYIIQESVDLSKGGQLSILSSDGRVVFRLTKSLHTPSNGKTTSVLTDNSLKRLFSLISSNDDCTVKSTFSQPVISKDGLAKRTYSYNPRNYQKDVWRFNVYDDAAGVRQYYKFIQNHTNKGGFIYSVAKGRGNILVGRLRGVKIDKIHG
ncbi:hypothetical protein PGT21_020421 [Puccinia graminis f. sp. tritici]|nr:hypothetical protein PGT21_020421 [Puccinia graminis f. sp. tritici]KAA1124570.1 hypothetical protein PGTUg99_017494 [Puccinia graminis f. sp. tritici]